MAVYSYLDAQVNIFDGTATTPNFIVLDKLEDHTLPLIIPEAQTTPFAGGGVVRAGNIVYLPTNELTILDPVPFSLTFWLDPDKIWQLDALGNPRRLTTWDVGTTPTVWEPILPANMGSRINSRGNAVPVEPPGSQHLLSHMFGLEARAANPPDATGSLNFVIRYLACVYTQPIEYQVTTDQPTRITFNGLCLGGIDTTQADFDATHVLTT